MSATAHSLITNIKGATGPVGPTGPQGLPGVNAVANDTATAGYISTGGTSATKTALDAKYAHKSVILVEDYGAVDDGVTDNTTAFRAAIAAGQASGRVVVAPGKVYAFTPAAGIIIPLTAGVTLRGGGKGVTTFKIKSGAAVNWHGFIGSNTFGSDDLTGLDLSGFTFDYNTAGNAVAAPSSLDSAVRAMVMVPKGNKLKFTDIDAINGDSIWVLQLGATSAGVAATHRVNDSYIDINVYNFGLNSGYHDSSAVYYYGDRNVVRGTYHAAGTAPGAICAVEIHGDASDVQITVDGFASGINATGCDATTNRAVNIHDCTMRNVLLGIAIWSVDMVGATGYGINGMQIVNNIIELNPDLWSGTGKAQPPGNYAHFGIGISSHGANDDLPIANLTIKGNSIRFVQATTTVAKTLDAGISMIRNIALAGTPGSDYNIDISDNDIDLPLSAGIVYDMKNKGTNVRIDNTRVRNPAQTGIGVIGATYATGVLIKGDFALLTVDNTRVVDDRGTTVANSALDLSGVTAGGIARMTGYDPTLHSVSVKAPVVGPTAASGVATRYSTWGWIAPTGNFAYGSKVTDIANGHEYVQTAVPGGASWSILNEVRPEGVTLGAAGVTAATPVGVAYITTLTTAGAPTAAPTVRSGMTPMVFDTNGKIWVYAGGVWKNAATA